MGADGESGNISRLQRHLGDLGRGWTLQVLLDKERADVKAAKGEAKVDGGAQC